MRGTRAFLVILCGVSVTVSAQSPPKRPRLAAGADTNSARAYYARGVDLLKQDPWTAVAAFHWATRLEPDWAEALYAQRVAGLMAQEHILMGYLEGVRSVIDSRQARRLDSLEHQAERLNPCEPTTLCRSARAVPGFAAAISDQGTDPHGARPNFLYHDRV